MNKILITGATSGIGEELARQLQTKGKLLLTGRNQEKLESLKQELKGDVEIRACDLSDTCDPILKWIDEEDPDLIFNNAGFGLYGSFDSKDEKDVKDMVNVNCMALVQITQKAIKSWKQKGIKGCIVNVSSCASFVPFPLGSLYAATKSFVTQLSQSLDIECAPQGIRILAACPGTVKTPFSLRASKGKCREDRSIFSMTTERCVKKIIEQAKEKTVVKVIDERYQFLMVVKNLVPSRFLGKLIGKGLKKRL